LKFNPIRIKPIKLHFQLDSDRDRIIDFKDCRPFNPRFQHISETTKKRIKHQPIYVSDIPDEEYHVLSKEARYKAPRARQEMLSAIKKYPSILGDFERAKAHEDIKYRFVHTSFKRPISIAQQARESIYFDKGKIDMDIGIQPVDALRNLRPFAKRYRVRQAEMEHDVLKPYEKQEISQDLFNLEHKTDLIKQIKKDSIVDTILMYMRNGEQSFDKITENYFDENPTKAMITLGKMIQSGLIKDAYGDREYFKLTEKGGEVLYHLDKNNVKVWKNPYYYGEGCNV